MELYEPLNKKIKYIYGWNSASANKINIEHYKIKKRVHESKEVVGLRCVHLSPFK